MLSGFSHEEKIVNEASLGESDSRYNSSFCVELAQDSSRQASNKSWSSDYGVFRLLNGGVVSCSLNSRDGSNEVPSLQTEVGHKDDVSSRGGALLKQKTTHFLSKSIEVSQSNSFDGSVSPNVRIAPTVLDWGQKYLYSFSTVFLTVVNTCNDSTLHLYEPFSTDLQFYPCNFSEVSLRPGESAIICFVFFPKCLGLSSASLILQTSSGGFIVEAKGYATESPFGIQPLSGLEISPGGRLSKNFSLFNPFDEPLYVEEITAWISISLGDNSVETEAICSMNDFQVLDTGLFPTIKDRLVVKSSQSGSPIVAIRPHRNWDIGPHSSETILEMDIKVGLEGRIFGAFCLHLLRSSQDTSDTIMVPIEAEVDSHSAFDTVGISVSATLEGLATCDSGEVAIIISLRNDAPYVLSFVKVLEVADMELFHIKYKEGLLLFPGTVTQVGIIYCSHLHLDLHDMHPKVSNLQENCKLLILTNDSTSPPNEIPCEDISYICFKHQRFSSDGVDGKSKHIQSGNMRSGYVDRSMRLLPNVNVLETEDVDELVLANWKSQGTTSDMSVLEDREVLFPMIQVGSYVSRWINVKNPSQHPVMMQLILNSGEIINECKGLDDLLHPSSSGNLVLDEGATPTKYGFSVPDSALTEAYVHPYDHVTLGPIIFYPSNRCGWSGSALIRNNLSGVEWIPLRGFGGLLSLVLLERSEHVQSVDFDLKMSETLDFSLPYALLHMKEMTPACSQPLVKELYAKNTGDLQLKVKSIRVSGRECGLDGFKIPFCRGFVLEPGESTKLLISYQTDFSAAVVHRDLELVLPTGIFMLPMKASFPYEVLSNCKKSMFWMRVKKSLFVFVLLAFLIFLIFWFIFPQTNSLGSLDFSCKSDDNLVYTTMKSAGKTSLLHHNQRKSKLSMCNKMSDLKEDSCDSRYSNGQGNPSELGISQHLMQTSENHKETGHSLDTESERIFSSTADQSPDPMKATQLDHLMVKTGKEKGRRKKRKSLSAKLIALSEVSSSQSGNSTPSSPLSPTASATPKCIWPLSPDGEQPLEALSSITQVAAQHSDSDQVSATTTEANIMKPAFALECHSNSISSSQVPHSASRSATSPSLVGPPPSSLSKCTVTLHDRAPGSKLDNHKAVGAQEADGYAYDIWGDHFSLPHLLVAKNVTSMKSSPQEKDFESFFVRGPQTLMTSPREG
ncbi:Transmembrane protein [Sesbania bispinosa]|nr:Transmembrane protein [Sesbania bispinosa]